MKQLLLSFLLGTSLTLFAQLNIDSVGHLNYFSLHNTMLNDVWGYTDETGKEYALVGTEKGTSVVDISDPSNPLEIFWVPGMESVWRDIKTYGDYAYVTTEAQNGLLIIDLSPLPTSTNLPTSFYSDPMATQWSSAHNIFIDEDGFAYVFGANAGNGGVLIFSLQDPLHPVEVASFDDWYVHDGFVQNDTMYLAHINDGFFSIVDITDISNPIILGTKTTPSTLSHNIWATESGQFVFTTDEVSGAFIGAYDVSDPTNIIEVDRIQSSPGAGVIPHNTHVVDNHIVTSYYADGIVIHDVTYPYNMIEVGRYDTYPQQTSGFDGCWGAFPFFNSGTILATDRSQGLFVLSPTYVQAAYLEGLVTNSLTLDPIEQVEIEILGSNQLEQTNGFGDYATGMAQGGSYDVTYSKVGFYPQTINVELVNGVIVNQNVQLVPIPPYQLDVLVLEEGTMSPIDNAQIMLSHDLTAPTGLTNGIGEENMTLFYEGLYTVNIGKWGYFTHCNVQVIDQTTGQLTVVLKKAIYDDFTFDFGWTVNGTAQTGSWERGVPNGSDSGSAPNEDVDVDCGSVAFVTGNAAENHPDADDVDNGFTQLVSPTMDLTSYTDPYVNYSRWFYCKYGPSAPDDTLRVAVSNGIDVVEIDKVGSDTAVFYQWIEKSIRLSDFITITGNMTFRFNVSDLQPNVNITEAGIDRFTIVEQSELTLIENKKVTKIAPNPFKNKLTVESETISEFVIFSQEGKVVESGFIEVGLTEISTEELKNGVYFLHASESVYKLIKMD